MSHKIQLGLLIALSLMFLGVSSVYACTYFFLTAKDGSIISGRTMEFYSDLESKLDLVPQGTSFKTTAPEGANALSWQTRYGFVAISCFNRDLFGDGMNEKGLSCGLLWFHDAKYPAIKPGDNAINILDVVGYILGNFQTVDEVRTALQGLKMWANPDNPMKMTLPVHFYVTDAGGNSIVLENIDGSLKIWDNKSNGVMTNEPGLGWHLNNLRFYANMNPVSSPVTGLNDEEWPLGSGLFGLPGDYTSASRFVKVSVLKFFSEKPKNATAGVNLALHLINNVDILYGSQVWIQGQTRFVKWTSWAVIYDHTNKHFYYRTYENPTLHRIDLNKLHFSKDTPIKRIELFGGNGYIDETSNLLTK